MEVGAPALRLSGKSFDLIGELSAFIVSTRKTVSDSVLSYLRTSGYSMKFVA